MEPSQETTELMTRFLLGQLSDEERKAVEERFLADDEYFTQLLVMEDSLVNDYVLGRLTDDQLKQAELLFRSSDVGKREVRFTRNLVASLREARAAKEQGAKQKQKTTLVTNQIIPPKTSPWLQSQASINLIASGLSGLPKVLSATLGLIVLLLAGTAIYFIYQYQRQNRELLAQQVALERSVQEVRDKLNQEMQNSAEINKRLDLETEKRTQAEEALAQSRNNGSPSITSLVLLPTGFQRSGGAKTVSLNAGTNRLQLLLEIPSATSYPAYSLRIKTFEGQTIWSRDSIPASQIKQGKLSLILNSSLFPYNDYRVELHGLPDNGTAQLVADYAFKVRK
jgi:hypothetical protein